MTKAVETKVVNGRPFGGTGFQQEILKVQYIHDRVTVMELNTDAERIIIFEE